MILLRLLSWPYARKHRLRTLLTLAGIVLGITVFVAMHTANEAVLGAFEQTVNRIAGATQLQVSAGPAGFEEAVLEQVQALATVRAAVPVIEAVVATGRAGQGSLLVLAVDMTGDQSLRDYDLESNSDDAVPDPLVFLAQPDSLMVTRDFAARNGLGLNAKLALETAGGRREFTVRGIMKSGGLAQAYGSSLAIMDVYSAQMLFGRGRRFDRIDLAVAEGVPVETVQRELRQRLGSGFEVEPPSSRGKQFESLLRVFSGVVNLSSWFALLIGMFIIYNSFSIAVTERRAEIGVLRALGATQGQVRGLFLGESALLGLVGSLGGAACGYLAAQRLVGPISRMLTDIFGITGNPTDVTVSRALLGAALGTGLLTSMVAAWVPARQAARVDPVKALQKGAYQVLSAREGRLRHILAIAAGVASGVCLAFGRTNTFFYLGYLLIIVAALALTPSAAIAVTRAFRPLLKRLRPVEGTLAADSLLQSPRRTSSTVAALMLSLSMVVGLGGVARSSYTSIAEWTEATFNPDLFVTTSDKIVDRNFHFPASLFDSLRRVEGIDEVQRVRTFTITVRDAPLVLIAADLEAISRRTRNRRMIAGDYQEAHRLADAGRGVIISENLLRLQGYRLGDTFELPTPAGLLRLPVAGIIQDFSGQQGTVFLDRSVYLRYWKDDAVDIFRVYLKPGASPADVKQRILERFSAERRLFVLSNREIKDYVLRLTEQWFGMTYLQVGIAILVAILGIVNTLTVSITDRKRELGVLRAVGGLNGQVRRTIWLEALLIGAVGLVLGLALGAVNLYYQLEMSARDFSGQRLPYEFPVALSAVIVPVILGAAWLAALGPAESAVRGSLVEALEYE